jgi:hypothetical protein
MGAMMLPLAAEPAARTPAPNLAPLVQGLATLRLENAALCAENAVLRVENGAVHERIRELVVRLGQTPANFSRPPSSDPPRRRRAQRPRPLAGSVAANRAIAACTARSCQWSRWTRRS